VGFGQLGWYRENQLFVPKDEKFFIFHRLQVWGFPYPDPKRVSHLTNRGGTAEVRSFRPRESCGLFTFRRRPPGEVIAFFTKRLNLKVLCRQLQTKQRLCRQRTAFLHFTL